MLDSQDGWLAETCKQNGLQFTRKSSDDAAAAQQARARTQLKTRFREQLKKLEEQLAAAEEKQAEKQIASLKAQIRKLRDQAVARGVIEADAADVAVAEQQAAAQATPQLNTDAIITDAWLRTLSRMPTDNELQTAKTWIAESKDPVEGIRGVLWALLNTREFIVNH
jgi:seryl-tRNA synthetase